MKYVAYNIENVSRHHEFDTRQEAQQWADDMNEKWQKLRNYGTDRFAVVDAVEYGQALDEYKADIRRREEAQKAQEHQEYLQHMKMLIKKNEQEIGALEAIIPVLQKFDNKVINVRLEKAMNEACGQGWYCHIGYDGYGLKMTGHGTDYQQGNGWRRHDPAVSIVKKSSYTPDGWDWVTGARLEAQKAIVLVEKAIADRRAKIDEIHGQESQYDEYLQKARDIEAQIKALAHGYGFELRQFCKDYRLHTLCDANYIWK